MQKAMNDNLSLFDDKDDEQISIVSTSSKLDIVNVDYIGVDTMTWEDLFDGFNSLSAITYSSGVDFICKLLKKFEKAEIIFGSEDVLSYSVKEILAFQLKTIELLREKMSINKIDLITRFDDGSLRLLVAQKQLSHEKIYLLSSDEGRKRVITGSANMSLSAFTGRQRENICYMDGNRAYDWYYGCYKQLREYSSDDITTKGLMTANDAENPLQLKASPPPQTHIPTPSKSSYLGRTVPPKHDNPNPTIIPIGDGFGFILYQCDKIMESTRWIGVNT